MAVATDHNPGTSPTLSLLLAMNMACTLFRLTVDEALDGVTRHAARALRIDATHGTLGAGRPANFVLWNVAIRGGARVLDRPARGAHDRPPGPHRRAASRRERPDPPMALYARDALLPAGWATRRAPRMGYAPAT